MADLILELFSEEIPARFQCWAMETIKSLATKSFSSFDSLEVQATPRRVVLFVRGLPEKIPSQTEEKRGPRIDAPAQALEGFLKANNISLAQCTQRETPKGTFWFYDQITPALKIADVLPNLVTQLINDIVWPKSMRWATGTKSWVRPLRSILCLFKGQVIPVSFDEGSVISSNKTQGHRFLSPEVFEVTDERSYREELQKRYVLLDWAQRREKILQGARALAQKENLALVEDEELLDELAGLVEWPVLFMGSIDKNAMALPEEILISPMRTQQRYLATRDAHGKLAPRFIIVSHITPSDQGKTLIQGNERVLRARLSDAQFYWETDLKTPLLNQKEKLKNVVFYKGLGTLWDKVERIKALALCISPKTKNLSLAADLIKADLVSGVASEFPELQGCMGSYYAQAQGFEADVCEAISAHYEPKTQNDPLPSSSLGEILGLADRLDTLVGFFGMGLKPSGSKDPMALRRAGLGLIRLLENREISLENLIQKAYEGYNALPVSLKELQQQLSAFIEERLKVYLREREEIRPDVLASVFAHGGSLRVIFLKARLLNAFLKDPESQDILQGLKRVLNILSKEEAPSSIDPSLFSEAAESQLFKKLSEISWHTLLKEEKFSDVLRGLKDLRPFIDTFFETVTVNSTDLKVRQNRIALLTSIKNITFADFSLIAGGQS